MAETLYPRLDILPPPQQKLWRELAEVPGEFVLDGETAIALQLGHRQSVDFDFFSAATFDPDRLWNSIACVRTAAQVLQKSENTLTVLIDRDGPVQVSFFGVPRLGRVREPLVAHDTQLKIADLLDLAGTKAAVVQKRAEAKDYLDVDALLRSGRVDLPTTLAAGRAIYGPAFNPEITLKALSYFGDGNLSTLPEDVQQRLVAAVKTVDSRRLPVLTPQKSWTDTEPGR